jgi:hypothetical protein
VFPSFLTAGLMTGRSLIHFSSVWFIGSRPTQMTGDAIGKLIDAVGIDLVYP